MPYPFCIPARGSLDDFTPIINKQNSAKNKVKANIRRYTAKYPMISWHLPSQKGTWKLENKSRLIVIIFYNMFNLKFNRFTLRWFMLNYKNGTLKIISIILFSFGFFLSISGQEKPVNFHGNSTANLHPLPQGKMLFFF